MRLRLVLEQDVLDPDSTVGAELAGAFGYSGTGSPAGQYDGAAAGATYRDTARTSGAHGWLKDATGWRVASGDTGWIDVSPAAGAINNHPAIKVFVRRLNGVVYAQVYETANSVAGTGATTILTLPAGFKPEAANASAVFAVGAIDVASGAPVSANVTVTSAGQLRVYRAASTMHGAALSWPAERAWPAL